MLYWTNYHTHNAEILGKRKKYDNTIYSFDIETTSYLILDGKQLPTIEYENLNDDQKERCLKCSCMYIWMFSINDNVYYGRTWEEFKRFINKINENVPELKTVFVHNLSFEFQYLKSNFNFTDVVARKSRKVMSAMMQDYNFIFKCTYFMTNSSLEKLPDIYNLPIEKLVGNLDYNKIRNSKTELSEQELAYCENDCLVIYYYIKFEIKEYDDVKHIPMTSTGHVRRELKNIVLKDFKYKRLVAKSINTDPHVYNLLQKAFAGGYTHSNWIFTDELLYNVDSWDFTSSYPYVMTTHKYPSTQFKKCYITKAEHMSTKFAYLLTIKFTNIKSRYNNNFISQSKCNFIRGARYDNGRVISADELEITITDVDFRLILASYKCNYEIIESYYSIYNYLPKQIIDFVLKKYVIKTQYKNVEGKETEYNLEKAKFNSLYGMSVTNTIRDEVIYHNDTGLWEEIPLTNEEIEQKLLAEKKQPFMNFAWGVWITAYARNNLIKNIMKLDEYMVYSDTDSIKVLPGYNKKVIDEYNDFVEHKIKYVSNLLNIPIEKFAPEDVYGEKHMLGVFDHDAFYLEFITQGAKKYAYKTIDKKTGKEKIGITVAGVPKRGAKSLKDLKDFKDNFVFKYEDTNKNTLFYSENQPNFNLVDYQGNEYVVTDKTGCCLVPTTYELGKALDYVTLLTDASSSRAIYKEV